MRRDLLLLLLLLTLPACVTPSEEPEPVPVDGTTEDATFTSGDLDLVGTLRLPDRVEGATVPGVILVHGSGPNSRDSELNGQLNLPFGWRLPVFEEIAVALQDAGFAVLAYDKRTCGSWATCENDYPLPEDILADQFVTDAQAAGRWLADHEAVDGVTVIGHSQGGAFMPAILAEEPVFVGGISLAGNWRPIDALLRYQLEFSVQRAEEAGLTPQQVDEITASLRQMVEDLEALRGGTFQGISIGGSPTAFWQSWMDIGDARPGLVAAETRPLRALFGDYDWNVPPDPEAGLWSDAGVPGVTLDCISHAMNCITNDDWQTLAPGDIGRDVSPDVIDAIVGWLPAD